MGMHVNQNTICMSPSTTPTPKGKEQRQWCRKKTLTPPSKIGVQTERMLVNKYNVINMLLLLLH